CPPGMVCNPGEWVCRRELVPSCTDGVQNGDESDIDCGGACPGCPDGARCGGGADCQSGMCDGATCVANMCSDGLLNGSESDIDCGGAQCPPCGDGRVCD